MTGGGIQNIGVGWPSVMADEFVFRRDCKVTENLVRSQVQRVNSGLPPDTRNFKSAKNPALTDHFLR